jgi:hypothetical protein
MIEFQSLATALAERPIGNQKSFIGSPSPGGEGWGEGGLNTDLAGRRRQARCSQAASECETNPNSPKKPPHLLKLFKLI